jgi:hypothetical protein
MVAGAVSIADDAPAAGAPPSPGLLHAASETLTSARVTIARERAGVFRFMFKLHQFGASELRIMATSQHPHGRVWNPGL